MVVAAKGPADEVALFVLMGDQMDVEQEEAADEAGTEAATEAATEAEAVAARLELLREEANKLLTSLLADIA